MSTIRVYQRKFKNRELGRQIEKLPEVHGYWIPETPAKTKPARLQKVYTKRCLKGNLGKSSLAQISEVEARGRASPDKNNEEKGHKSQCSSDDLIDLNKSISDWEDVVIAPGGSKDSGYSGEPACFVVNSSGCSGEEGDFSCREALSSLSDIKACTNNVARHLDFGTSGESNEGLYEWNAPLNSTTSAGFLNCPSVAPPFQESETATTQGEASQESSNAPIKDAIGWITVSSFKVSASRIDRNTVELSTENFLPESHNLLHNLDVDNDTSNTGSHVTRCGQDKVSQEVECLEPATPLLKHNINKRPRNVTDVNQRPLKRSKNRKHRHRPKIAGQGRSKRTVKNSPVKNKEKRNYVVKKEKKNHVRKTESMKKGETSTQQTSTTEYCTNIVVANSSLLSVVKQPNDDNMMEIVKPNMGVLEVAVTGCQSSDDKVRLPTVSIVSELAASHASDMKSTMQSNVGSFGGQKLLNDLDLQVNSFRWSIHGTRSARDYCRNPYVRNQTGFQFQHRPSWVHQMPFKVNHCLSNIRKVEPNFPKRSRRRRIKRQRKSIVSISGDRRFKPWKGSVVDSVVGVFLTQNVSDFLSSSAYMSLAAKCPVQSTSNKEASADDLENKNSQESTRSNVLYTGETQVSHGNQYFVTDPEHETPVDMVEGTSLVDIEDIGNTILPQEYCRHESEVQRYENPGNASSGMESLNPRSNSKSSEAEVGMKGNLHTQSELNEIQLNILNLDFLNRVYEYHGSIDLEWLRYAPQDLVKEYLLEIPGLGLKSVECVRLLALKNIAFPVDINVARISVRLGWIPLEPLPGDLQFHLLEEYPVMDSIQQYLWPRLCELDQKTLYELHYHMITFGKVVCTKKNPNCGACPMKAECRHLASAIASANLSLPGPSKKVEERYMVPKVPLGNSNLVGNSVVVNPISVSLLESNKTLESELEKRECGDSLPYLLAIWTAGETPDSCEPPKKRCNSQGPELCNDQTCFSCQSILEDRANIVRGTILVFADHESSYSPIIVPRSLIWQLKRGLYILGHHHLQSLEVLVFDGKMQGAETDEFICMNAWFI
ncbi:hypothetical protein GH714_001429 [Hevea brasiliensis]|uniref:Permuted single zf-CXXC unit domain-containing protein n=1 Tax=Hevea brasiliensis TaxID=3981 RepID=A0A6A6NAU8_HEVBR|nr:hypothetical protein GH714_001429 [Hevea brasiliensis]